MNTFWIILAVILELVLWAVIDIAIARKTLPPKCLGCGSQTLFLEKNNAYSCLDCRETWLE